MDMFERLRAPFGTEELRWRVAQSGEKNGRIWAKVLTYIDARAIQERLDEVCGPGGWQDRYLTVGGGIACTLAIKVDGEWIEKTDGAGEKDPEATGNGLSASDATKAGFTDAFKRAASKWGIGRYLYGSGDQWAECYQDVKQGRYRARLKDGREFSWDPPRVDAGIHKGKTSSNHVGNAKKHVGMSETAASPAMAIAAEVATAVARTPLDEAKAEVLTELKACGPAAKGLWVKATSLLPRLKTVEDVQGFRVALEADLKSLWAAKARGEEAA